MLQFGAQAFQSNHLAITGRISVDEPDEQEIDKVVLDPSFPDRVAKSGTSLSTKLKPV